MPAHTAWRVPIARGKRVAIGPELARGHANRVRGEAGAIVIGVHGRRYYPPGKVHFRETCERAFLPYARGMDALDVFRY